LKELQAKRWIRETILKIGGPRLTNKHIFCIKNENGVSKAAFTNGKLTNIGIGPPIFWKENPERLIAVTVHEYANRNFLTMSDKEIELADELNRIDREYKRFPDKIIQKRRACKAKYEVREGVIIDQLIRKIKADAEAIKLIRNHLLLIDGYLPYLYTELNEVAKFAAPRRTWHIEMFLIRIMHAEALILNPDYDSAHYIKQIEKLSNSSLRD